jgi:hypothetical protein
MQDRLLQSRAIHCLLLALPFVAVALALHGLTRELNLYQGFDELVHYQIVLVTAEQWPRPLLSGYNSWSGPLIYWMLATLGRPLGTSLTAVRLVVMTMSWATCATVYVIMRDRLGARPLVALALAAVLALSPFFFGESFRVLTDNPTWLFVALALERLLTYVRRPDLGRLAAFAIFAALASVMRQVSVWLFLPALVTLLSVRVTARQRLAGLVVLVLGLVPVTCLLVYWGGAVVGGAGPAVAPIEYRVRNVLMTLAVVGFWSAFIVPSEELKALPGRLGRRGLTAVGIGVAMSLAALVAHALRSLAGGDPYGIGIVGRLSETLWGPLGTSLSWWLLVPLGTAALVALVLTRSRLLDDRVLVACLLGLLISAAASGTWYQRYVDFPVLLILAALAVTAGRPWCAVDRLRLAGVVGISLFWTIAVALAALIP